MMHPDDIATLEALIDRHGLPALLDKIAEIAAEKAEHIAINWQDTQLAKQWIDDSATLARLAYDMGIRH